MASSGLTLGERIYFASNTPWFTNLKILFFALGLAAVGVAVGTRFDMLMLIVGLGVVFVIVAMIMGLRLWWYMLIFLLTGYMFGSRGFAGLGYYPFFVGEVGLALGLLTIVLAPFSKRIQWQSLEPLLRPEFFTLVAFLMWSLFRTVPYVGQYQFDTLRDAMSYGYALFALIIIVVVPSKWIENFFHYYGRLIIFAVSWFPLLYFISSTEILNWLRLPWSDKPLIYSKGTDVGPHLAGIAAYMLLGLERGKYPRWVTWYLWLMWAVGLTFYGSAGRANFLSSIFAFSIVILLRLWKVRINRPILLFVIVMSLALVTGTYSSLSFKLEGAAREVSLEQLVNNLTSVLGEGNNEAGNLENTKQWRLQWWDVITNYTFYGKHYWLGKGYGINLATDDGFQVEEDESLRSPHNIHMMYLARSGVPGYVLWTLFLVGLFFMLARKAIFGPFVGATPYQSRIAVWLIAYLGALVLMASFDVFLEGPMGGVWFWSLIGMAYAYLFRGNLPSETTDDVVIHGEAASNTVTIKNTPPALDSAGNTQG